MAVGSVVALLVAFLLFVMTDILLSLIAWVVIGVVLVVAYGAVP